MKKNNFFAFIVTLTLFYSVQGQSNYSGEIQYEATYDKTLIDEKSKIGNKEGIEGANMLIKSASNITAKLTFNQNESCYKVDKKLKVKDKTDLNITFFLAGGSNIFYHNRDSLNLLQTNESLGKTFVIKRDIPNWIITKETKKINDLVCVKAYTIIPKKESDPKNDKDKIGAVAWFCPKIPIAYGPMEYFGLPGLIIELKFSKLTFIAKKINLNKENVVIEKPDETKVITVEEFNTIARKKVPSLFEN